MGDMDEVQRLAREVNRITTSSASLALLKALSRLEAEHKRLEGDYLKALEEIEAWKNASGLERGGDPDAVKPADVEEELKRLRSGAERLRKALRGTRLYETDTGPCWCPSAECLSIRGRQPQCAEWAALLEPTT